MDTDSCFYHGNRVQFDVLTKTLNQCHVIPKIYLSRLAMAVCVCRKKRQDLHELMTDEDFRFIIRFFDDNVSKHECFSSKLKEYVIDLVSRTRSIEQYGPAKFLYILYDAVQNKTYEQLTYDAINTRSKPKSTKDSPRKKKTVKMTPKQFDFMKRKKLSRKDMVYKLTLPMFPGHVRILNESCNAKLLKKKFGNGLFLWYDQAANAKHVANNENLTDIILYCENQQILKDVESLLKQSAEQVQETKDAEWEKRKEEQKARKERLERKKAQRALLDCLYADLADDDDDDIYYIIDEYSFNDRDCRKVEISKLEFDKKRTRRSSKLDGGHCLNCLADFSGGLHSSQDSCHHHPGFIVEKKTQTLADEYKWSCCGENSEEKTATHAGHRSNGCYTTIHNWRRGKNLQEKNKGDTKQDREKGSRNRKRSKATNHMEKTSCILDWQ